MQILYTIHEEKYRICVLVYNMCFSMNLTAIAWYVCPHINSHKPFEIHFPCILVFNMVKWEKYISPTLHTFSNMRPPPHTHTQRNTDTNYPPLFTKSSRSSAIFQCTIILTWIITVLVIFHICYIILCAGLNFTTIGDDDLQLQADLIRDKLKIVVKTCEKYFRVDLKNYSEDLEN